MIYHAFLVSSENLLPWNVPEWGSFVFCRKWNILKTFLWKVNFIIEILNIELEYLKIRKIKPIRLPEKVYSMKFHGRVNQSVPWGICFYVLMSWLSLKMQISGLTLLFLRWYNNFAYELKSKSWKYAATFLSANGYSL